MKVWRVYYFLMDGRGLSYQEFSKKKTAKEFYDNVKYSVHMKDVRLEEYIYE